MIQFHLCSQQRPPPHTACQEITNDWIGLYQDIGVSRAVLSPILTYASMGCDCHRAVRLPGNCAVPARNHNFASLTARLKPMPFHGGSRQSFLRMALTTRNGPDHNKRLFPGCDCIGERGVGRLVGEVFFAGEEAQERAALLGDVVADGAAQHGIARLERVQHRALRGRTLDLERHLAADMRQVSEMEGEDNSDHLGEIPPDRSCVSNQPSNSFTSVISLNGSALMTIKRVDTEYSRISSSS